MLWRRTVTAGAPSLQVSLLCCGGSALSPLQNVSAPPLLQSEKQAETKHLFSDTFVPSTYCALKCFAGSYYINRGMIYPSALL